MNPSTLLGQTFACDCGKTHAVPVREVVYAADAIRELPRVLTGITGARKVALLADHRTHAVAGQAAAATLQSAGWQVDVCLLPDPPGGHPVCDDVTFDAINPRLPASLAILVAVGSGVISDLGKWIATRRTIPYVAVATAASMNGYASANIAPAIRGVKRIVDGKVPEAVLADPAVLAAAPYELTTAGLGDVIAKPVSMTDWRINQCLFGEYYCALCAQLIREVEPMYWNHPEGILQREPATLRALFDALIYSGIAMTIAGTSFPASGGEHMVSHVLDMKAGIDGIPHDYHGRQVGLGTILAGALYERLLATEAPDFRVRTEPTDTAYWQTLAGVVEEEHALKRMRAERSVTTLRTAGVWDRVRALIRDGAASAGRTKDCLRRANAAHTIDHIGCSRERFKAAVLHCHQIRERYTVIDLARAAGILPGALDDIIDEFLA